MLIRQLIAVGSVTFLKSRSTQGAYVIPHKGVHLPSRPRHLASSDDGYVQSQSVTGLIYEMPNAPSVKLFTKQGCTLCDKVKDVRHSWLNLFAIAFSSRFVILVSFGSLDS